MTPISVEAFERANANGTEWCIFLMSPEAFEAGALPHFEWCQRHIDEAWFVRRGDDGTMFYFQDVVDAIVFRIGHRRVEYLGRERIAARAAG
jgi:hypothetical protein